MGDFNSGERKTAEYLKKLDFSRYSKIHKEKLWQSLTAQSNSRHLSDDDIDMIAAAGVPQPPQQPDEPPQNPNKPQTP